MNASRKVPADLPSEWIADGLNALELERAALERCRQHRAVVHADPVDNGEYQATVTFPDGVGVARHRDIVWGIVLAVLDYMMHGERQ